MNQKKTETIYSTAVATHNQFVKMYGLYKKELENFITDVILEKAKAPWELPVTTDKCFE